MTNRELTPSVVEANYFYLFTGLILLTLGSIVQNREIYTGLIITEYLIIFLPTIFYLKLRGYSLKRVLRLNKLSLKQIVLIPLIVVFSYPTGVFLNYIMITIISAFGEVKQNPVPIPQNTSELLIGLVVIALSAGICEEIMFRGFIMKSYEKYGMKKAILASGVLFGLFHLNLQNLLGPIFLGVLFGYIVYKTDSIYSSVIAHTTNNAIALFLGILILRLNSETEAASQAAQAIPQTLSLVIGSIFVGIFAIAMGVFAFLLLKALPKTEREPSCVEDLVSDVGALPHKAISVAPIILFLILFVYISYKTVTM